MQVDSLNSESLILFEGTNSHLRISVNGMFSKKNKDNTVSQLITVSQQKNVTLRPNAFLVFSYYDGDFESLKNGSVYTSNPHLPKLRTIVTEIKDAILSGNAFLRSNEDTLFVAPDYERPESWIIPNIGKDAKQITFALSATSLRNDETGECFPSVNIALSGAKEWCLLTIDEFLTIYQIIMDVNLTTLAVNMANTALIYSLIESMGSTPKQNSYQRNNTSQQNSRNVTSLPNNYVGRTTNSGYTVGSKANNYSKVSMPSSAPRGGFQRNLPQEDNDGFASEPVSFQRPADEPPVKVTPSVPSLNNADDEVEVEEEDWGSMSQIFTQSQRD